MSSVFGIGGESLAVAQNTYAVSWFKGKELNMVFGFQLSFSRVGSSISFYLMMPIYKFVNTFSKGHTGLAIVIMIASLTCVFSLISAIILAIMDKRKHQSMASNQEPNQIVEEEKIRITDVKNFPANFWILSLICVMYYLTIFPFVGLAQVFFKRKYDLSDTEANSVNSCVYIVAAIISPLCGFLVDRTGRNIMWISLGTILTFAAHFLISFTTELNPSLCTVLMGIGYSILASALWPMVSLIIPHNQLSTAYGRDL